MSGTGDTATGALLAHAQRGFTSPWRSDEHGFTPCGRSAENGFTPCGRSAENGFTLIETLVVMAVVALIAGISFPRVEQSLDLWHFRSSQTSVQAALEDARADALLTGAPTRFTIASSGTGFSSSGKAPITLEPSVRFGESSNSVAFFSDGSSTGGHVVLNGATGRRATIAISPDTGMIGLVR